MKVVKNYFWNVSYQLIAIIIPIIIIPYINKTLGPSGVGINSYTYSLAQMFMILGDLGVANYGTKTIASVEYDKYYRSKIFIEITLMRFVTISLSYGAFLFIIYFQGQYLRFYLLQGIIILASIFDISWFYMGVENFKIVTIRNFIIKIFTIICIFIFVKNKSDLGIYIAIMSSSNIFGNLSMFVSLDKWVELVKISFKDILKHLRYSIIFFIPQIAMQIYQTLDKFIIGKMINVKATGFFDNSDKIMNMLLTVISSLSAVMLPHIANIMHNGNMQKVKTCFYKYFNVVLFLSIPMTAGIAAISLKFAPWFFGEKFYIVGPLMMIESLTIVIIGMSLAFSSYFMATNQIRQYNIAIVSGAFISLTIGIYLIYLYGLLGSMWSADLTEFSITVYEFYILRHQLNSKRMFTDIWSYILGSILLFFIVFYINEKTHFDFNMLIIEVTIGILIYSITILIMKPKILTYIQMISSKVIMKFKDE